MANIDDDEGVQKPADGLDDAWERRMQTVRYVQGCIWAASLVVLMLVYVFGTGATEVASFSAQDARRDPRHLQAWCLNGGEVVASYAGVALAWGQVPGFCVPRKEVREFILLLWGRGVLVRRFAPASRFRVAYRHNSGTGRDEVVLRC
ncbi:hypothetical protein EJB05_55618, partial [Eragrostis curvula]